MNHQTEISRSTRPQMTAFYTILRKELLRTARIWRQTVLPPAVTTALYFVIFGKLMGQRIGQMQGVGYIDFILPGLIMMAIITNSYANVSSSFFSSKFQKNIEEILVSSANEHVLLLGYTMGGLMRGLMVALAVSAVSLFFTRLQIHSFWVIFSVFFLSSLLFSLAGLLNALFARTYDDISIIPTFVITPLTYLGGIFFSIELLPPLWQKLALLNPVLYMVNAFRFGFLGQSDVSLLLAYAFIAGSIILLYGFCFWLVKKGKVLRD